MEYRIKKTQTHTDSEYQIQVKKKFLFFNFWVNLTREVRMFDEIFIEEYVYGYEENAIAELKHLKYMAETIETYIY